MTDQTITALMSEIVTNIAAGSQARKEGDPGVDGFTTNAFAVAKMEKETGFKIGDRVRLVIDENEAACDNLNGYFGVVAGTHCLHQDLVAIRLEKHPGQTGRYGQKHNLVAAPA